MPRPQSEKTKRALELIRQGVNPHAAAIRVGIPPSTVYRARARERKEKR